MQIRFHELENKVKILVVFSPYYLMQFDNIRVVELLQQNNLAKSSLGICRVLEGIKNFLKS